MLIQGLVERDAMPGDASDWSGASPGIARRHAGAPVVRHGYRPPVWRTRLIGLGGTTGVFAAVLAALLITWQVVRPTAAPPALAVFDISQPAAPPQPVQEVPEGPKRVEQQAQQPVERVETPPVPEVAVPRLSPVTLAPLPPVEAVQAADPVPETTAPKSLPAPPARHVASNAEKTWESLLLAHLEKFRRYPATARARREQGVAHLRFRMNRSGKLLSADILRSSGSALLDRAALDTLRRAQPLPGIPDDRPDELELSVPVEFFVAR